MADSQPSRTTASQVVPEAKYSRLASSQRYTGEKSNPVAAYSVTGCDLSPACAVSSRTLEIRASPSGSNAIRPPRSRAARARSANSMGGPYIEA